MSSNTNGQAGRREPVDDRAFLSDVTRLLHTAKAHQRILLNTRRAKRAAEKRGLSYTAPTSSVIEATSSSSAGGKRAKAAGAPAEATRLGPKRSAGGSIWVTLKCGLDAEQRIENAERREADGLPPRPAFVLPSTNTRYERRQKRWAEAAADEPAVAAAAEDEEQVEEVDDDDDAVAPQVEQQAATFTQTLLEQLGRGDTKCIVRARSSLGRVVRRKRLPPPKGATSATGATRAKAETSERRRCRRRRVKQQRTTTTLTSQKQASTFAASFMSLLRREVYPSLKKSDPATIHVDPTLAGAGAAPGQDAGTPTTGAAASSSAAAATSGDKKTGTQRPAPQQQQQQPPQKTASSKKGGGGKRRK